MNDGDLRTPRASAKGVCRPRIQFYVPDGLRGEFYEAVGKRFGKTSGGAVSDAGCEALRMWIGTEKVKAKRKDVYSAVGA